MNIPNQIKSTLLLLAGVSMGNSAAMAQQTDIISFGDNWTWLHPTNGVDPAIADTDFNTTWYKETGYNGPAFNATGDAPYGYGGLTFEGTQGSAFDIGTPASGSRYSAYFRKSFTVTDDFENLEMTVFRDDSIAIYIDGVMVGSDNFGALDTYTALADGTGAEDASFPVNNLTIRNLDAGPHFIAVSLHNGSVTSSDLGFDLQLTGEKDEPPVNSGTIIDFTDQWDWLHPLDGIDPAVADPDFNTTWYSYDNYDGPVFNQTQDMGPGIYSYGSNGGVTWITSGGITWGQDILRPSGPNGYTAYFKKEFTLEDPANQLEMEIFADDGVFVYLDGVRIGKDNVTGDDEFFLLADGQGDETRPRDLFISVSELNSGTHVMAVSLHNDSATSSDQGFAMKFIGNILVGGNVDSDGDGMTDLAERTAGTDPEDPSSILKINELIIDEFGCATVTFDGIAGKGYDLEFIFPSGNSTSILDRVYVPEASGPTEVTGFFVFGANLPTKGFFRLTVPAE